MRFIVVDGILDTRLVYVSLISKYDKNCEIIHCESAEDALWKSLEKTPDVIIASDKLSFRSAFDLSKIIDARDLKIPIIVISNDESNALDAIKTKVFDFILAPVTFESFVKSMDKLLQFLNGNQLRKGSVEPNDSTFLQLRTQNGFKFIDGAKLAYCKAEGAYTKLVFVNGEILHSSKNLGKIESSLMNQNFVRISRSMLVNKDKVRKIDRKNEQCMLRMEEGLKTLRMTRSCIRKLEEDNLI